MNIRFNSTEEEIKEGEILLHDLLLHKGLAEKTGIAVAVNQTVIPRTEWRSHTIYDKDQILVIKATQGG